MPKRQVIEVINDHAEMLMAIPGVVTIKPHERSDGSTYILVETDMVSPEIEERIPRVLDGYMVVVVERGVAT